MFRFIKGFLFFVIAIFLFGFITMSLWNALVPGLFHGPILDYWEAIGLLVLAKIFFGGFHGHHRRGCHGRHCDWKYDKDGERAPYWYKWKEEFDKMTPEEKEKWKTKMKEKWKYKWDDSEKPGSSETTNS